MKTRSGVTLLEVLVSIFIMGIGLLSLLTLFPAGAVKMTQAMKDARCAEAGNNARCVCFSQNIMHDPNVLPLFYTGGGAVGGPTDLRTLNWNGPSWPVFVDPIGIFYIGLGVNAPLSANLPRTFTTNTQTNSTALRWFSLPDDY